MPRATRATRRSARRSRAATSHRPRSRPRSRCARCPPGAEASTSSVRPVMCASTIPMTAAPPTPADRIAQASATACQAADRTCRGQSLRDIRPASRRNAGIGVLRQNHLRRAPTAGLEGYLHAGRESKESGSAGTCDAGGPLGKGRSAQPPSAGETQRASAHAAHVRARARTVLGSPAASSTAISASPTFIDPAARVSADRHGVAGLSSRHRTRRCRSSRRR